MPNLSGLTAQNAQRWRVAKTTRDFSGVAKRLVAAKDRYQAITRMTGVPWFVIAVIHQREASQSWSKSLAQGDPWDRVSTHVPKGRGPFDSWEVAAVDALTNCPPYAARNKDWSSGGTLTLLEKYNGLGYFNRGLPSPYIWSGTDQYVKGKYVADGVFDPNVIDVQLGCAGLIMAMRALDPSIRFADEAVQPDVEPVPLPKPRPDAIGKKHIASASTIMAAIIAALKSNSLGIAIGIVAIGIIAAVAVHFLWPKKG